MAIRKDTLATSQTSEPPTTVHNVFEFEGVELTPLPFLGQDTKMLITGDTGSGKTSQLGHLAEYLYIITGGKPTVLFTMDEGGFLPIRPQIEAGVIVMEHYDKVTPPWLWLTHALRGEAKRNGQWTQIVDPEHHVLAAYEGLTAFAEFLLENLSEHSAEHPSQAIGGESAWTFQVSDGEELLKLASNTMSHYGLVQMRIMHEILKANPGVPSLWTAILTRAMDPLGGGILGPQTVGKAQAPSVPRWFDLTFRINAQPVAGGQVRHDLYLATHTDAQAKGAKVIANSRLPLSGQTAEVQRQITPASIVIALQQIQRRQTAATDATKARLARLMKMQK